MNGQTEVETESFLLDFIPIESVNGLWDGDTHFLFVFV